MLAVKVFDTESVYNWLQRHCWAKQTGDGDCVDTAIFIHRLFGWVDIHGEFHSWNKAPGGRVLDLTVGQFGFSHATRLVLTTTVFAEWPGGEQFTYKEQTRDSSHPSSGVCSTWIDKLDSQLCSEILTGGEFGISRRSLLARISRAKGEP